MSQSFLHPPHTRGRQLANGRLESVETPKQIVYRYNGDSSTDEVEMDILGNEEVPLKNSLVSRKGRTWTVVHVEEIVTVSSPKPFQFTGYT